MSSFNVDLNYFENIKTMRLEARLGRGAAEIPLRLMAYVGKHSPETGCLRMLEAELEHVAHWWGEKGVLVSTLVELELIHKLKDNLFEIHDWLDYNGHLAAYKKRAKKAARKRWGMLQASPSNAKNDSSNAKDDPKQCPDVDVTYVTKQDVAVPPNPQTALPSATSTAPETANGHGLKQAGKAVTTLRDSRGRPVLPDSEIPDSERMSAEEMEAIRRANMSQAKPVAAHAQGDMDDVF